MYEKFGSFDTGAGGGTADYAFMMLIGSVWSAVSYPILRHFVWVEAIFTINLMFYVMYVWSRRHPDTRVSYDSTHGYDWECIILKYLMRSPLSFTISLSFDYWDQTTVLKLPVDASYVPFVHLAISLASGSSWFNAVHGIITGYVYCRIVNVIQTPQFLIDNFGRGVYAARSPGSFAGSGRRFWDTYWTFYDVNLNALSPARYV